MARHAHTCSCCGETVWCHAFVVRDEGFSYCRNYPLEMNGRDAFGVPYPLVKVDEDQVATRLEFLPMKR